MSGSLYTPYPSMGPLQSFGQAFQGGFLGAQQIESNVQEMERRRQAARLAELQEQRAQSAEQRAAEMALLARKQTAFNIQQSQFNAPLERRIKELQARGVEQTLGERAASTAAIRGMTFPALVAPGATPPPAAGVAVPGTIPGFRAPVVPGPQAGTGEQTTTITSAPAVAATGAAPARIGDDPDAYFNAGADQYGQPVGMPVQSPPPPAGVSTEALRAPAPGEMEAGLTTLPPPEPGSPTERYLATRTPEQLQAIIDNGTPSAVYGQRRGVSAGAASLAAAAREELARRSSRAAEPQTQPQEETPDRTEEVRFRSPTPATTTTTAADTAAERGESPSTPYILEPLRIEADRRRLTAEYGRLQQQYRVAVAARNAAAVAQLAERADQINQELRHLNGMTAITRFNNGDVAPLAGVLHAESGNRLEFEPRSDGTFNVYLDGRLSSQGVTREQMVASARMQFDTRFQQLVQQRQQQTAALALLQAQETIKQNARTSAEAVLAVVKAQAEAAAPNLDVRGLTDAQGNQFIVVTDKRTGQTVSGARIVQVPGTQGAQPTFTIEPTPVGQR